jgi:hypothetical protein
VSDSLKAANAALVAKIRSQLADDGVFATFKAESSQFMRGQLSAKQYHERMVGQAGGWKKGGRMVEGASMVGWEVQGKKGGRKVVCGVLLCSCSGSLAQAAHQCRTMHPRRRALTGGSGGAKVESRQGGSPSTRCGAMLDVHGLSLDVDTSFCKHSAIPG